MTVRPDGGNDCDSCGRDVGAASLLLAVHVGDIDPGNIGQVRNLRFCRRQDGDPEDFVPCGTRLLDGMLDHYEETVGAERREQAERAAAEAEQAGPEPDGTVVSSTSVEDDA